MNPTRYEMETIINFNGEEKTAGVYTHNGALLRKLDKTSRGGKAADYTIPKAWVRITPARQVSEAQREALRKARFALKASAHAEDLKPNSSAEDSYISQRLIPEKEA